jgi:acyl-CoA synthetase (AMP-forming)/AMP-acid ligase II
VLKAKGERVIPSYVEFEGMNFPQVLDLQAKRRPDKVLFVHGEERVTFKEFSDQTDDLAAALKRHGLRRGEPCGLVYPNGMRYLLLKFAILKVGAILIPLNTRYRSSELNFMLDFSDARFLFMVKGFLKADFTEIVREIKPNLPRLEKIYVDGEGIPEEMLDIDQLFQYRATEKEKEEIRSDPINPRAPATILFTSGTTALPKGVVMSHEARVWVGIRIAERMLVADDDALLNPLPFCHEFGGFTIVSHALICGCKMVIMDMFNAEEALRLIEKEKISVIYGVPTMFSYMLNSPRFKDYDLSSLRTGYMSGATCPLELVRRVQEDMGCNISVAYGLSEAPSHTISEYEVPPEVKARTVGKPVRDAEVKIVDDLHREVPPGTHGEIAVKGKNTLMEYYKRPDLTQKAVDPDGFLYTGDLGQMDETGYLTFVGRKTDMIVSGGFNVFPLEVEELLYRLPFVALAAVVGLPDSEFGETVCACIVLKEGMKATPEEVVDPCRKQLANYKVPKRVEFMESLPTTIGTNKIKKTTLVEMMSKKI